MTRPPEHTIIAGTCHAVFAFDLGQAIDLERLEQHLATLGQRDRIRRSRRSPRYFSFEPPPIRMTMPAEPIALGRFSTNSTVSCIAFEFGAISVAFTLDLAGPLLDLAALSAELYDSDALHEAATRQAKAMLGVIEPFVSGPDLKDLIEDYFIFEIRSAEPALEPQAFAQGHQRFIAQVLRSETAALSEQEVTEAVSSRLAYAGDDVAVIDWNAALLLDPEADDVIAVLEFANVELLELRQLDAQLDGVLARAYRTLEQPRWPLLRTRAKEMRHLATLQVDGAMLFERINNALKLFGDQYLARLYRMTSNRLHIDEWDTSILRKLETAEGIYSKISDFQATRRMEILEWIIILLIALSIVLAYVP